MALHYASPDMTISKISRLIAWWCLKHMFRKQIGLIVVEDEEPVYWIQDYAYVSR